MVDVLEEICRIANIYDISPRRILNTYNKSIGKKYVNMDTNHAIELTERFINRYFDVRKNVINYKPKTYHTIEKEEVK
jgi:hypothetical protein